MCSERLKDNRPLQKALTSDISPEYTPIMIQENNARLNKSNHSLAEWRELEEEDKGVILALHSYENMIEFVTRYHTEFNRQAKDAIRDAVKKSGK